MPERLRPLSDDEAASCGLLFRLMRGHLGFVPNSTRTMARNPAILSSFTLLVGNTLGQAEDAKTPIWLGLKMIVQNVRWTLHNLRRKDRLPLSLKNMIAHVTSGAAGCRYCQAHTIGEARDQGVPGEKLAALWDFESSDQFSEAERAALRFASAAGACPNGVTDDHFVELKRHYTDEQIVEIGCVIALFGYLNRWNDSFATQLESDSAEFAGRVLGPSGWTIGKHGPRSRARE